MALSVFTRHRGSTLRGVRSIFGQGGGCSAWSGVLSRWWPCVCSHVDAYMPRGAHCVACRCCFVGGGLSSANKTQQPPLHPHITRESARAFSPSTHRARCIFRHDNASLSQVRPWQDVVDGRQRTGAKLPRRADADAPRRSDSRSCAAHVGGSHGTRNTARCLRGACRSRRGAHVEDCGTPRHTDSQARRCCTSGSPVSTGAVSTA